MRIEIENLKGFSGGWSGAGKRCDYCKTAAAAAFCRSDSAFLCLNCDTKIHEVNKLSSRHERVWMCEVCEQAPAAVTCKADAASLCVTCDADIHAANPLARRHERVPVEPFYDSAESIVNSSSPINFLVPIETDLIGSTCQHEDTEGTSWFVPNQNLPSKLGLENHDVKLAADLLFSEMNPNPFLDFDYPNSIDVRFGPQHHRAVTDSVVPVQTKPAPIAVMNNKNCLDIDFCKSKISPFNYAAHTLSQSVSSSSMDAGVVPDGNSMSDISYSFSGTMTNGGVDPSVWVSAGANQAVQLCGIDREARVLRYREKRKNRKFEKTIRYASRKAYAETRPRIKGRFAKRTEVDKQVGMDRFYGSQASVAFMADTQYGIVPSF
ncbi:hypothetical protein HS088_TW23G00646 [Tripterygium wilfordii]|uniref:Zinc finger protein CONSTANS-LIKE 5 n=1 Tax=Tripterygium wilfordii TaxID=458696 RepID=A0A7J7BVN7_TRIWF|nr:zinc finger protein CONSTANS-LIKE 5-like [Tripterygium wilfordii]KAF5725914.1 hypothetical protein HS088_TW23G00646 [Tripterygium wilfordii]